MAVFKQQVAKKAPNLKIGVIHWLRENLFSSVVNSVLTLLALYLIYLIVPTVVNWALFDSR
jgi:general L-amino acid transport system permease protein